MGALPIAYRNLVQNCSEFGLAFVGQHPGQQAQRQPQVCFQKTKGRTDTQCAMRYEPRMPFSISRMRLPAPEGNRSSPPRPGGGSIARASDAGGPACMRNGMNK